MESLHLISIFVIKRLGSVLSKAGIIRAIRCWFEVPVPTSQLHLSGLG